MSRKHLAYAAIPIRSPTLSSGHSRSTRCETPARLTVVSSTAPPLTS